MGRKSTKENKNIYQISREEAGFTREAAAELLEFISSDRIEKIENEKSLPHPDEILAMADCYKNPTLCNYYCSHECPIGQEYVPEVKLKDLSQITLEMLASLNSLEKEKMRLVEITVDGVQVSCKGNNEDSISVATWQEDNMTYSISSTVPLTTSQLETIIKSI